jgi:hypothetical protein
VNKKMLQTQVSVRQSDLADSFRSTVGRMRVGPHAYAPDMTAPEGVSTGGGVQSTQHVRLLPPQSNMPTLVVGSLDHRQGAAELRTFEHVDAICRERFKQGAPLDPAQYAQFLQGAASFLGACGLRVTFAPPPTELREKLSGLTPSTAPPRSRTGAVLAVMALVVIVAALAVALTWFFVKK